MISPKAAEVPGPGHMLAALPWNSCRRPMRISDEPQRVRQMEAIIDQAMVTHCTGPRRELFGADDGEPAMTCPSRRICVARTTLMVPLVRGWAPLDLGPVSLGGDPKIRERPLLQGRQAAKGRPLPFYIRLHVIWRQAAAHDVTKQQYCRLGVCLCVRLQILCV